MRGNKLIDVYPYSFLENGEILFMLFKRSESVVYSGQWRMIGGKVEENETYWQAALREFGEETGVLPNKFWNVPTLNSFYLPKNDEVVHAVPFAAEIDAKSSFSLNHEHSEFAFLTLDEALSKLNWPEQKRILRLIQQIVLSKGILDEWIISNY